MKEQKIKRILLNIREDQNEILIALKDKLRFMSTSEVMRFLITEGENKHLNNYREIAKMKVATALSPEERAQKSVEKEAMRIKAKESLAEAKQTMICKSLGGTVSDDGYCKYPQFVEDMGKEITVYPQSEPLESLSDKHKEYQFLSSFSDDRTPQGQRERIYLIASEPKNVGIALPSIK